MIGLEQLTEKMASIEPESHIVVSVDRLVPFEKFIHLVDLLKGRRLENLSIMVRDAS